MLANSHLLVKCLPYKAVKAFPSQNYTMLCNQGRTKSLILFCYVVINWTA